MTPERWQQVKAIFSSGIQYEPEERAAFLSQACGGDEWLRSEVESLIASHEKDGSFIDSPAYQAAAELLVDENSELKAGQTIGHYQILSTLGRGGMGEVYLAHDVNLGRNVALKCLPKAFTKDRDRLRRFEHEARAASALNHPNICTIYEVGQGDGHRFIVMESVEGQMLRKKISAGPVRLNEALHIAEQIASALAAAHAASIVHRDIKPENIMIRRDGYVKILDFGLAKLIEQKGGEAEDSTRLMATGPGVVMGTVSYMSPEQARGLSVDARTDIWSLGVVLYEMLSGRQPFGGPTPSDIFVAILEHEPKSLTTSLPHLPEVLAWIVSKALTKEREDRYQTAHELLTDLRRLQQRLSVNAELDRSAPPQSISSSAIESPAGSPALGPARGSRRIWKWAPLLAILILASVVAGWKGGSWFLRARAAQPVVVLMDSPLPDRVYDPETRKAGGTNADDITDILRDLPIVIEKENTSPIWHREDQVLRERPSLIVIHRSCFADSTLGFDPQSTASQIADNKIETFLGYIGLGNPNTKFLVYTRRSGDPTAWIAGVVNRFPSLNGRVFAVTVEGGAEHATFRDPDTKKMVRQQAISILGLQQ